MNLNSFKNEIQVFASNAKNKILSIDELSKFVNNYKSFDSSEDQLSFLQFCSRYSLRAKLSFPDLDSLIAKYYYNYYQRAENNLCKLLYLSWATRYDTNINEIEELLTEIKGLLENSKKIEDVLNMILFFDGLYYAQFDENYLVVDIPPFAKSYQFPTKVNTNKVFISSVNSDYYDFSNEKKNEYNISGLTHNGEKPSNDDNILFAELSNNEVIVAVADGSGNSNNAQLSSNTALKGFLFSYLCTLDLFYSIKFSSAAIRNQNLKTKKDGETTLTLLKIDNNQKAFLISIGDCVHIIKTQNDSVISSKVKPSKRWILGCEPLGNVITSSGNILLNLNGFKYSDILQINDVNRFLLGSDGILTSEDINLNKILDYMNNLEHSKLNDYLLKRSLHSHSLGKTKQDNISIISGFLN